MTGRSITRLPITRRRLVWLVLLPSLLVLTACAAGANDVAGTGGADLAGFWLGLWQGLISPIAFIVSLFNHNVGIYEVHNNGAWYDFGFMLGVMIVFSGGGAGSGRSSTSRTRSGTSA